MAECIKNKKILYTIILNEEEAKWLKDILQNPIFDEDPADEPAYEFKMRSAIWNALDIERKF